MLRFLPRDENSSRLDADALKNLYPYEGVLAKLLYARGLTTKAKADLFLSPSLSTLHNPFLLKDMEHAVSLLVKAKEEGQKTLIYGDYDCDGICATTVMMHALKSFGLDVNYHIPQRSEGYGLNKQAIEKIAKTYKLLVTVDLGITNHEEVLLAQSLGMTVIVTDHHALPLTDSPANASINPLLGDYPFRKLCGTGVAFKVGEALLGFKIMQPTLDLVALATVCDMVSLRDENRVLVHHGLKYLNENTRVGLSALLQCSGHEKQVTEDTCGMLLGPRLNASGRLGDANDAVKLLLTEDFSLAMPQAQKLEALNHQRKQIENTILKEAEKELQKHSFIDNPMLILVGENWHAGVLGLVAGKLCQKYYCPVCVLSEHDGQIHGSLRSIKGIHIQKCLQNADSLLLRYGGHAMAAGVTLLSENKDAFFNAMQSQMQKFPKEIFTPTYVYDSLISISDCTAELYHNLLPLRPFGMDNPAPLFVCEEVSPTQSRAVGVDGSHLKLVVTQNGQMLDGIAFSKGYLASCLADKIDLLFSLEENTFRGKTTMQAMVHYIVSNKNAIIDKFKHPALNEEEDYLLKNLSPILKSTLPTVSVKEIKEMLNADIHGSLLLAYSIDSVSLFTDCNNLSYVENSKLDARCFNSILCFPKLSEFIGGDYRNIYLLDGQIGNEKELLLSLFPKAKIYTLAQVNNLQKIYSRLDAGDEAYRKLYKQMRLFNYPHISNLANDTQLTLSQTQLGLRAFGELNLIEYHEVPFTYAICPPKKCLLSQSPTLGYVRSMAEKGELNA